VHLCIHELVYVCVCVCVCLSICPPVQGFLSHGTSSTIGNCTLKISSRLTSLIRRSMAGWSWTTTSKQS
jgi:hypothetical protein